MNEFTAEYRAARALAKTEAYAQVRKEHPKIERKLAEIIRYRGGRRTRYRGHWQVAIQYLSTSWRGRQSVMTQCIHDWVTRVTALVVNVKRMVKLLSGDNMSQPMTATS